ncbi:hypothetical protein ACFYOF_41830 [Streptomyces sp. NPDC007148]|uniref:hypothetical protein n=1 Tax=Streptomyces sp. NPDC007148 TaxID=3364775 RepID=UPI0036C5EA1F
MVAAPVVTAEWDYWAAHAPVDAPHRQVLRDWVHPIRDARLLEVIDVPAATAPGTGVEVAPGVRLFATPGTSRRRTHRHRPVRRHHRRIHHPVQIARPRTASSVDADAAQAVCSRMQPPRAGRPVRHRRPRPCAPTCPPPTAGTVASEACPYDLVPAPAHTPNHPTRQDTSPTPSGKWAGPARR